MDTYLVKYVVTRRVVTQRQAFLTPELAAAVEVASWTVRRGGATMLGVTYRLVRYDVVRRTAHYARTYVYEL